MSYTAEMLLFLIVAPLWVVLIIGTLEIRRARNRMEEEWNRMEEELKRMREEEL